MARTSRPLVDRDRDVRGTNRPGPRVARATLLHFRFKGPPETELFARSRSANRLPLPPPYMQCTRAVLPASDCLSRSATAEGHIAGLRADMDCPGQRLPSVYSSCARRYMVDFLQPHNVPPEIDLGKVKMAIPLVCFCSSSEPIR